MTIKRYPDGSPALVDIEAEGPEWLEWCGAMYESYASDHEWYREQSPQARLYARSAMTVAEDLEYALYEEADRQSTKWEW